VSKKMKRAEKLDMVEQVKQHYAHAQEQGSTGSPMQVCEGIIRDMLNARGIQYATDMYARGYKQDDARVKDADGQWLNVEIKHGGGAIAYAERCGIAKFTSRDRDLCLQGVDYVVYCLTANPDAKRTKMATEYRVSTREDFLDMLEEYCHGPKAMGFQTATKFSKEGRQINIQTTYLKSFWEGLQDDPRAMVLWDFCTDVLGRDPRWDW